MSDLHDMLMLDHREAIRRARQWVSSDLVVFDTETTSLMPAEIVEISVVDQDGDVLLDTLVKPVTLIEPSAYEVHGISDDDCKDAPTITDLLPQLEDAFANKLILSYNLDFDAQALRNSFLLRGKYAWDAYTRFRDYAITNYACIMLLYAEFGCDWSEYHRSYTWQSLGDAAHGCRVSVEAQPHRALNDARTALAVLRHMAERETSLQKNARDIGYSTALEETPEGRLDQ